MAWTDERLDDLAGRMDTGFARVDADIRDLRTEMRDGFRDVRAELKGDIAELRSVMFRFGAAFLLALIGLIATLVAAAVSGAV